jgi:hypothetical protein
MKGIINLYQIYLYIISFFKKRNVRERRIHITPCENSIDFTTTNSPLYKNKSSEFFLTTPSPPNKIRKKFSNSCCICLEPLDVKKYITLNNCKHEIHVRCIKEWFKEHSDCPLCRGDQTKLKLRIIPSKLP